METALKILSDEHQNILRLTNVLLKECDSLQSGSNLDKEFLKGVINFVRGYADKFHHAKEEDILFVELCKDEVQMHCNPTEQMLHEHDLGRNFIKELESGVEEENKDKVIENARGYAELLQDHIFKEDSILYSMADEYLSQDVKDKMLEKFKQIEQELIKEREEHLLFLNNIKKENEQY